MDYFKSEFKCKHFGFSECQPIKFYTSQWFNIKWIFCLLKFILFGYWFGFFVSDLTLLSDESRSRYWIYLTNWGVVIELTYFLSSFILSFYGLFQKRPATVSKEQLVLIRSVSKKGSQSLNVNSEVTKRLGELRWFHKIVWILFEISFGAAIVITVAYWTLLDGNTGLFSVNTHAINTVIIFVDFVLNNIPIRLLHFFHLSILGIVYTLFSLILHWSGYTSAIYPILNWSTGVGFAIGVCLVIIFIASPIIHGLIYGLYKLKLFIYNKILSSEDSQDGTANNTSGSPTSMTLTGNNNVAYENETKTKEF